MLEKKEFSSEHNESKINIKKIEENLNYLLENGKILKHLPELHEDLKTSLINFFKIIISYKQIEEIKDLRYYYKEHEQKIFKKSKETAEKLLYQLTWSEIRKLKKINNFSNLISNNYLKLANHLEINLFILSLYYIIKYINYLIEINNSITKIFKLDSKELIKNFEIAANIQLNQLEIKPIVNSSLEDNKIIQLLALTLYNLTNNYQLDKERIRNLVSEMLHWARIKDPISGVKKLLKDKKYRKQITKELIHLADIIWFKIAYPEKEAARQSLILFKELIWKEFIIKENDRWLQTINHNNPDTEIDIPFCNITITHKDHPKLPLWEFSFRVEYTFKHLMDIFTKKFPNIITKRKWSYKIKNRPEFVKILIKYYEPINHILYKQAQDIRIIRVMLKDWQILKWVKNKRDKKSFINNLIDNYRLDFYKELKNTVFKKLGINIPEKEELRIKNIYYKYLLNRTDKAITDIAWATFKEKPEIENLNLYKILPKKSEKRKEFIKHISKLLEKLSKDSSLFTTPKETKKENDIKPKLKKISKILEIPKISWKEFNEDVEKLYHLSKLFYKHRKNIQETAIFYPIIEKKLQPIINKTKKELKEAFNSKTTTKMKKKK